MQALFIQIFLLLSLFDARRDDPVPYRISGYAQGTTYQITYYASDPAVSKMETDSILTKIDSSLSIYKPNSLINRFNDSEKGMATDKHFAAVVRKSLRIFRETRGVFDITVKPLVQAWGFGVKPIDEIPDSALIKDIMSCVGSGHLRLKGMRLIKDMPCVQIDVNGIAQGYTVDVLARFLEKKGVRNYLVELGGEIRARGRKPSGEFMSIGIESPPDGTDETPLKRIIQLPEGAVTTSGTYRKYRRNGNKTLSHLIDSRTGRPINNELISVTVIARDAITADGYDNALMAMGLKRSMEFVRKHKDIEAYFIYHDSDGSVTDTASTGFYNYFK